MGTPETSTHIIGQYLEPGEQAQGTKPSFFVKPTQAGKLQSVKTALADAMKDPTDPSQIAQQIHRIEQEGGIVDFATQAELDARYGSDEMETMKGNSREVPEAQQTIILDEVARLREQIEDNAGR